MTKRHTTQTGKHRDKQSRLLDVNDDHSDYRQPTKDLTRSSNVKTGTEDGALG